MPPKRRPLLAGELESSAIKRFSVALGMLPWARHGHTSTRCPKRVGHERHRGWHRGWHRNLERKSEVQNLYVQVACGSRGQRAETGRHVLPMFHSPKLTLRFMLCVESCLLTPPMPLARHHIPSHLTTAPSSAPKN